MSTPSQVLWALDQHISPRDFERLCVDLLSREGYWSIVPVGGTRDLGRDAEASYWRGKSQPAAEVVFQFSLEKEWERKLRSDIEKIARIGAAPQAMVFVTSQTVTGEKQDKLRTELRATRGWELTIRSREWLRLRLEEFHPDLAKKYLGVELSATVSSVASQLDRFVLDGPSAKELFRDHSADQVRAMVIESTRREPLQVDHWQRLAKIECYLENFQAGLEAMNHAMSLEPGNFNVQQRHAAILAELGIQRRSKPHLLQAQEFFARAAVKPGRGMDHFNLANVLAELDDLAGAEAHYLRSLELNPCHAQSWKNLGTLYTKLKKPEQGMECFDKALEIEPRLVEAHLSKANNWLMFFDKPDKAVDSFKIALAIEPQLDRRWGHYRYWYGRALMESGQTEEALVEADAGLRRHPDNRSLLDLKAEIFSRLWPTDPRFLVPAQTYFSFRLKCIERDFEALLELMKIHEIRQMPDLSWTYIELNLDEGRSRLRAISEAAGVGHVDWRNGLEAVANYRLFRERYPVDEYCEALRRHGLTPDPGLGAVVGIALLPVFGRAFVRITECAKRKDRKGVVAAADEIGRQVAQIMAWFGTAWLATTMPEGKDERIDRLSRGVIAVPDLAVMETSRLFAVIGLHQGVAIKKLSKQAKWGEVHTHCMELLLERVIDKWQMRKTPEDVE